MSQTESNNNCFDFSDTCKQKLYNRKYYSPDIFTGGFSSITFHLNQSGEMFLIDSMAVEDSATDVRGLYRWEYEITAQGNWCLKDNFIFCNFFKDKDFIKKTFFVPDKVTNKITHGILVKGLPPTLIFPELTDTLIIRGIPCIRVNQ